MATLKEGNPLWTLRSFYFLPCDVMYQHLGALKPAFFSDDEQTRERVANQFLSFMLYWFASLFVVAEGWRELKISEPTIDQMLDKHWDSLRLFRNAVFHFQRNCSPG